MTPPLMTRARRFASPAAQFINAKLEPIHQPLYSLCAIDSGVIPRSLLFFQYPVGGTVAGTGDGTIGGATTFHTNMETAGFLANPKLFLVTGIRCIPWPLVPGSAAASAPSPRGAVNAIGETIAKDEWIADFLFTWYCGVMNFVVGPKNYLRVPLWNVPANTGVDGFASAAIGSLASASIFRTESFHSSGRYYALSQYPILIPAQQSFNVSIDYQLPTNPSLNKDAAIYVQLDGVLGREVA